MERQYLDSDQRCVIAPGVPRNAVAQSDQGRRLCRRVTAENYTDGGGNEEHSEDGGARASAWKSGGLAEKREDSSPCSAMGWYLFMAGR